MAFRRIQVFMIGLSVQVGPAGQDFDFCVGWCKNRCDILICDVPPGRRHLLGGPYQMRTRFSASMNIFESGLILNAV